MQVEKVFKSVFYLFLVFLVLFIIYSFSGMKESFESCHEWKCCDDWNKSCKKKSDCKSKNCARTLVGKFCTCS